MSYRRRERSGGGYRAAATWVALVALALGIGLAFVYFKHRLLATGTEIKLLEREIARLRGENEAMSARVSHWSSRSALERRLADGFIQMVEIPGDRIVRLGGGRGDGVAEEGVRPVASRGKEAR